MPASMPSGPSRIEYTSGDVEKQVTMTSASRTASAGVAAWRAPLSFANSAALPGVRFQTVRGRPAPAIRAAIGRPIAPSPRKAVFMLQNIPFVYLSRMITRARVEGMTCQHCVRAVFTALAGVPGIIRADVSMGSIEVEHDGSVSEAALREAVSVAGYSVVDSETNRRRLPLI